MASSARLPRLLASASPTTRRCIHATALRAYPRQKLGIPPPRSLEEKGRFDDDSDEYLDAIPSEERDGLGSSSMGHLLLRQQRHMLNYLRLIEHDMPNLVRK